MDTRRPALLMTGAWLAQAPHRCASADQQRLQWDEENRAARLILRQVRDPHTARDLLDALGLWTDVGGEPMRGKKNPDVPPYVRPSTAEQDYARPVLEQPWPREATRVFLMCCLGPNFDGFFLIVWRGKDERDARASFAAWLQQPQCTLDCDFGYLAKRDTPGYDFRPVQEIRGSVCIAAPGLSLADVDPRMPPAS